MYTVIVGNIGQVAATEDKAVATKCYRSYTLASREGVGRAAGEDVTLLNDGNIMEEYCVEDQGQ